MAAADVEVGKADFDFYSKFAKPLILTLNSTEDRILASAWFSKLRDEASGTDKLRLDYLKLLLFVLQRHRLAGPFLQNPNIKEELEEFEENYDLATIAKQIIEKEQQEKREKCLKRIRGEIGDFPPFSTDYSPDLREYVAAQDIPNFGVHVYYALSKHPILDWDNSHHAVFPKAVRRMEPQGHLSETSFAVMEPRPETPDEDNKCKILEETGVMPDLSIFTGRKARERKSPYVDMDRPAPPLGVLPGEGETGVEQEDIPPPTWGSNLIEVREPLEEEGPETPPPEETAAQLAAAAEAEELEEEEQSPEDPEIVELLEKSFNMEDILAEVDAMETEEERPPEGVDEVEIDPAILEEERKFQEMEDAMDKHDAIIAAAMAELDEDEQKMLQEMEAEEAAPKPKSPPKKEVKVVADENTVIKVLVEAPEVAVETREEKKRKAAKAGDDKKKKPAGRTGLNKTKAKGAVLKASEKKALEKEDKKAKVVGTKTGVPASGAPKRPGVPKAGAKAKVAATASTGKIPLKPSGSGIRAPGTGIPRPGAATGIPKPGAATGIPRPGARGIPRPGGTGIPRSGARGIPRPAGAAAPERLEGASEGLQQAYQEQEHMQAMMSRLQNMLDETRANFPESFVDEQQAGPSGLGARAAQPPSEGEGPRQLSPIEEISMAASATPGSPEADDIYDEMEKEYAILERLYQLYQQLAPDQPEGMRTPPLFSKHPEIRQLGRQLRYRADEFDIHPMQRFEPGLKYFSGPEGVAPGTFVDPREAGRYGPRLPPNIMEAPTPAAMRVAPAPPIMITEPSPPPPEAPPPKEESPPWRGIEEMKRIVERADKRVDTSPAISAAVGVTTPQSPATPKRPAVRRDLRLEFGMESPPEFATTPPKPWSPPPQGTPEFVRIQSYGFPEVITDEALEQWYAEKYPEQEAYIRAEMEAERGKWAHLIPRPQMAPQAPEPPVQGPFVPGPSSYQTPVQPQRGGPRARTPPSVGGTPTETPEGVPQQYRFRYYTPPWSRTDPIPEPIGPPEFEKFDPLEHEDIIYQTLPDLVEAEFDEFDHAQGSPQFELKEWYDPLKEMAAAQPYEMGLEFPEEMMSPDLVPFEEEPTPPASPVSPIVDLQQRLMRHQIEPEFRDPERPLATRRIRTGTAGTKTMALKRKTKPSRLARKAIEEDISGEMFEEEEDKILAEVMEEEEKFIEMINQDPERTQYMKRMVEEAQAMGAPNLFEEEEPPSFIEFDEEDLGLGPDGEPLPPSPPPSPFLSPVRTPERPVKPVVTPPPAPGREQLLYAGTPERYEDDIFLEGEADFLASPGFPSPPRPPTPPAPRSPGLPTPPRAPTREHLMLASPPPRDADSFLQEDMELDFLASPDMPAARTLQEQFAEIGSPIKLPPPRWEQPPPPPQARRPPTPPRIRQPSPGAVPMGPPGSPEFDPAALQRELRGHEVRFPRAGAGGFRAGKKFIGRRSARNYQYFPIVESLDYEGSKKMPPDARSYRHVLHKLPPAPPPATSYPPELMGDVYHGPFPYPDYLIDREVDQDRLPEPLEPEWHVYGYQTPPHLRTRPVEEMLRTPPRRAMDYYQRAYQARDPILFEEAPEGLYVPTEEEEDVPLALMREGFVTPPRRQFPRVISPETPVLPPRPPGISIPSMTMDQQMSQAAQMAQLQAQQLSPRRPSPQRPPPSPQRQPSPQIRTPPPGPSRTPPSPDRLQVPTPGSPPCAEVPEPLPKVTKRMKEISFTKEVFDPDSPETSTKWTKGQTLVEFNRPQSEDQRPVQTPSTLGVAVYARGPPATYEQYSPRGVPQMPMMPQERVIERRPVRRDLKGEFREARDGTPRRGGGLLPRRRIMEIGEARQPRRLLFGGQDLPEMEPLYAPQQDQRGAFRSPPVCPGTAPPTNERIQIVEEFEETEHDFIPEHLRGFRWMDEPSAEDPFYGPFRQQFQQ